MLTSFPRKRGDGTLSGYFPEHFEKFLNTSDNSFSDANVFKCLRTKKKRKKKREHYIYQKLVCVYNAVTLNQVRSFHGRIFLSNISSVFFYHTSHLRKTDYFPSEPSLRNKTTGSHPLWAASFSSAIIFDKINIYHG